MWLVFLSTSFCLVIPRSGRLWKYFRAQAELYTESFLVFKGEKKTGSHKAKFKGRVGI